jgi:RNA-directed DNA polymerase
MKLLTLKKIQKLIGVDNASLILNIDKSHVKQFNLGKDTFYKIDKNSSFYKLNQLFAQNILPLFPINNAACGYVKGKSYLDFLFPHRSNTHFMRLDIRSFFPSIQESDVKEIISSHFDGKEYEKNSLRVLAHNVFFAEDNLGKSIIPIGFSTSPAVSNIIFRKVDIQIQLLCERHGIEYTRYADDLLFSSTSTQVHSDYFEKEISFLVSQLRLQLNTSKTLKTKNVLSLNGYKICGKANGEILEFSNKKLKAIRHLIHLKLDRRFSNQVIMQKLFPKEISSLNLQQYGKEKFIEKYSNHQILNKFQGFRSHLLSIIIFSKSRNCISIQHNQLLCELVETINIIIKKDLGL